jgi:hypothetical protein
MSRNLVRALFGTILTVALSLVAPATRAAAHSYPSPCLAMTDSITRLYHAYFDRDPDPNGFNHWVNLYQTGQLSLEEISDHFVRSEEFSARQLTSNRSFVDWLYRDVLGPQVPPTRQNEWIDLLNHGYNRGTAVLTFTESSEYVAKTDTERPLAGYLRWYPKGTHWQCNLGRISTQVRDLTGQVWADYYFDNRGQNADAVGLWTLDANGRREITMVEETLEAGFTDYNWDGAFSGDGNYGRYIEVQAGPTTDWIVVFYPRSVGPDRLGWQIS